MFSLVGAVFFSNSRHVTLTLSQTLFRFFIADLSERSFFEYRDDGCMVMVTIYVEVTIL